MGGVAECRPTGKRRLLRRALFFFALVHSASAPLSAQMIMGEVRLRGSNEGLPGVDVGLLDPSGSWLVRSQSDSAGAFLLSVPGEGAYQLIAARVGLTTVRSQVELGTREILEVELAMSEEAIVLDPIVVVARRRVRKGTLDEFYERMERMKRSGKGYFFTREDLEKRDRIQLALVLQSAPGVLAMPSGGSNYAIQMVGAPGRCSPDIYLDGRQVGGSGSGVRVPTPDDGEVSWFYVFRDGGGGAAAPRTSTILTEDLEGVEIYRHYDQVDDYWPSRCGTIFLWRKDNWGSRVTLGRVLWAGGIVGVLAFVYFLF